MERITLALSLILIYSCSASQSIQQKQIAGVWCLTTKAINYPTILFKIDSLSEFGSRMDTVYTFKYKFSKNNLSLVQRDETVKTFRIEKLTKDTLIFESLLEHKTRQVYYRCSGK
jgi:hypothetical protein